MARENACGRSQRLLGRDDGGLLPSYPCGVAHVEVPLPSPQAFSLSFRAHVPPFQGV